MRNSCDGKTQHESLPLLAPATWQWWWNKKETERQWLKFSCYFYQLWPPPSHRIPISFHPQNCFDCVIRYFYFLVSLFDIFYASRVFVSLMMLSLLRISFLSAFIFTLRRSFSGSENDFFRPPRRFENEKKHKNAAAMSTENKIHNLNETTEGYFMHF